MSNLAPDDFNKAAASTGDGIAYINCLPWLSNFSSAAVLEVSMLALPPSVFDGLLLQLASKRPDATDKKNIFLNIRLIFDTFNKPTSFFTKMVLSIPSFFADYQKQTTEYKRIR